MAGITGPCPSCRKSITAPVPEPEPASPVLAAPIPVVQPAKETVKEIAAPEIPPVPAAPTPVIAAEEPVIAAEEPVAAAEQPVPAAEQPVPVAEQPAPVAEQPAPVAEQPAPVAEEHVPVEASAVPPSEGRIKPEPRHIKERAAGIPIAPRHSTVDESLRPQKPLLSSRGTNSSRFLRLSGTAAFCAAATAVSYILLYFYLPSGPGRKIREASAPLPVPPFREVAARKLPTDPPLPSQPLPEKVPAEGLVPPPGLETDESPAVLANNVLDAFLTAKDAASRTGLVEPAATAEQLAATLLKGPLPEVAQILPDLPQHDAIEQSTDYPYRVSFFLQSGRNVDFAILVRQRGNQSPKVFLPAFLDLAGGRLSAFAKEPNTSDPTTFHVILDPLSVCHDETVPGAERKITFKLLPSMFGKEITRAYVSSGSRFAQMVGDPNSSLRWGVRMRATITIQWNHTEDPQKPFLELMNISSLNWNS